VLVPLTDHVALVSMTSGVSARDLLQVGAAVQKQVARDFAPAWGLPATVDVFADLTSVPSDYHPVVVFGDGDELAGLLEPQIGSEIAGRLLGLFESGDLSGVHLNAFTRQPFALIEASDAWSVTVSHEILELIADPFGNRLVAAAHPTEPGQRVKYLVEICDPCQSRWYPVNGVPVSDFYTQRYFDPVRVDGVRYSFTGALEFPLQVLDGGYVTWIDPASSALYQLRGGEPEPVRLTGLAELGRTSAPLRVIVDTDPRTPRIDRDTLQPASSAAAAGSADAAMREASDGAALRLAEALASLASGLE
jgi:hypothetical protein